MSSPPWSEHYPPGTRPEIGDLEFEHLAQMVRATAQRHGAAVAFTQCMPNGMNGSLRFEQVDRLSDEFATYLREVAGLEVGDRVAVQMPNCLAYPVVSFGILKAGCVLVNTNPLYTATEMTHQFADADARALVIVDMFAGRLPSVLAKTPIETVVTVRVAEFFPPVVARIIRLVQTYWDRSIPDISIEHTTFQDALEAGRQRLSEAARLDDYLTDVTRDSLALLQYTGGTTGVPKGAMLSHGNLLANTAQMLEMAGAHIRPGEEVVLTALPLYHIFAFTVNLLGFYQRGASNILVPSPRPPSNLKRAFENYSVTWLSGVNTLFNALLNERWFVDDPPKRLRGAVAGGMALHGTVAERWRDLTGTPVVEGYGLTESSPVLTFNPLGGLVKDGSIGIPMPSTQLRCVNEDGTPVPTGEPGEIVARGPQIMQGYWRRPDETKQTIVDGWLHTGDIAVMDDNGFFRIVDRKKDVVIVSGFNVYPNEVEACIAAIPGITEVAVVGAPDPKTGESVQAYVVAADASIDPASIVQHCREHLAAYKIPRKVEFRDELPKNLIGKILRKDLRVSPAVPPTRPASGSLAVAVKVR
jgi:long-chain acyl-CoA synthetase